MQVIAIRRPGQRGTRRLLALYGERLVCVRYRYDPATRTRYKTVELVVDQTAWTPSTPHPDVIKPKIEIDAFDEPETAAPNEVGVKVFFREHDLRDRVKRPAAAGRRRKSYGTYRIRRRYRSALNTESRSAKGFHMWKLVYIYRNMFPPMETVYGGFYVV